jgi:hypothetical protein
MCMEKSSCKYVYALTAIKVTKMNACKHTYVFTVKE